MMDHTLVERLTVARDRYYAHGISPLTDREYDQLERRLYTVDPGSVLLSQVGAPVPAGLSRIRHALPMLSIEKAETRDVLVEWLSEMARDTRLIAEPKIDGMAASCRYREGRLQHVATRGDGYIGRDITWIAEYVQGIPETIPLTGEIEVRGELSLPRDRQGENLRAKCVGLIHRRRISPGLGSVSFTAYRLAEGGELRCDVLEILRQAGFGVAPCYATLGRAEEMASEISSLYEDHRARSRELPYETDGMVLVAIGGQSRRRSRRYCARSLALKASCS